MPQEHARQTGGAGVDRLFDTLTHPVRRRILASLRARALRGVDELASGGHWSGEAAERRAKVALYHNHLPLLDDAGYVRWDRETDTVTRGPRYDEFRSFCTLMDEHSDDLPFDWPTG